MTDWYYHDPIQGRVGPLAADDLRARYRERAIQRDTLVWHQGLREWQPLERQSEELDLANVTPDATQPPPLPPAAARPSYDDLRPRHATAAAPKRGLGGCAIVAIVLAVVAVPMIGILAAIALPAYQDYTVRARVGAALASVEPLKLAVLEHAGRTKACPGNDSEGFGSATSYAGPSLAQVQLGELDAGHCALELTLRNVGAQIDGTTVVLSHDGDPVSAWDCTGGTLPPRYRTSQCRPGVAAP